MSLSLRYITTPGARVSYWTGMYSYSSVCVQAYISVMRRNTTLQEEMKKVKNNKKEKAGE